MQDIYMGDIGKGFPLVLVHGFLGSSEMWEPQIKFLKKNYRVITPDLPGFGKSNKVKSHNRINDMANTVLGLRGVPETIREAAIAYGASKWYLLRKVDLPLATPSILAGVNQTVMLSLAMVVVASLIGAKGLGQDVLEALQYANVGQGILAGVAILFVALILDRVVQGKKRV